MFIVRIQTSDVLKYAIYRFPYKLLDEEFASVKLGTLLEEISYQEADQSIFLQREKLSKALASVSLTVDVDYIHLTKSELKIKLQKNNGGSWMEIELALQNNFCMEIRDEL